MKILNLKAENFKRLTAVDITPGDDNMVVISGKNGQGKTSVIDAIWAALAWSDAAKIYPEPIHQGAAKAEITLNLGELVVKRKWTDNDHTYLTVETSDGAQYKSPQAVLDKLVGSLSFDPLEFTRMTGKQQRQILLGLAQLSFDLDKFDAERKLIFDKRTEINREIKRLESSLEAFPDIDVVKAAPDKEVDSLDLIQQIQDANDLTREIESEEDVLKNLNEEKDGMHANIKMLEERIQNIKNSIKDVEAKIADQEDLIDELKSAPTESVESLKEQLKKIEVTNHQAREKQRWNKIKEDRDHWIKTQEQFNTKLDDMDQKKIDALAGAKLPVEGLGFTDDGILFQGIPFSQCSDADQLKISLSIGIALNPKLRVIRIRDGSLLDSESLAQVEQIAKDTDMQIWIEKVDDTGKVGIVIEDGGVKNA